MMAWQLGLHQKGHTENTLQLRALGKLTLEPDLQGSRKSKEAIFFVLLTYWLFCFSFLYEYTVDFSMGYLLHKSQQNKCKHRYWNLTFA